MRLTLTIIALLGILFFSSCEEEVYHPKPRGYMRFDFPEKSYTTFESECGFSFDHPSDYSIVLPARDYSKENCVLNLEFPRFKGTVHLTYRPVQDNLRELVSTSRDLAMEHHVMATRIHEKRIQRDEKGVHGIFYKIDGNVASNVQFFVTDSTNHFFRGALYFAARPNADSLAPMVDYVADDINHMLESLQWTSDSLKVKP